MLVASLNTFSLSNSKLLPASMASTAIFPPRTIRSSAPDARDVETEILVRLADLHHHRAALLARQRAPALMHSSVPSNPSTASTVPFLTTTVWPMSSALTVLAIFSPNSMSSCWSLPGLLRVSSPLAARHRRETAAGRATRRHPSPSRQLSRRKWSRHCVP